MRRRLLARQIGRRVLRGVTGRLHLAHERVLIGRQARLREHVGIEVLLLREGDALLQPAVQVLEHLHELGHEVCDVHGAEVPHSRG
jgi:hypothetical protein